MTCPLLPLERRVGQGRDRWIALYRAEVKKVYAGSEGKNNSIIVDSCNELEVSGVLEIKVGKVGTCLIVVQHLLK